MNSLAKRATVAYSWLKITNPAITTVRNHWNKDYAPGPYPLTEEQRVAAAKKYGLLVQDYEAYPDDGDGAGDYPKLPVQSADSKDPFYPWDSPELKRNFEEVIHDNFDFFREDRMDVSRKLHLPMWALWLQFFGTLAGFYLLFFHTPVNIFLAVAPPQLPKEGQVHYTFDTETPSA